MASAGAKARVRGTPLHRPWSKSSQRVSRDTDDRRERRDLRRRVPGPYRTTRCERGQPTHNRLGDVMITDLLRLPWSAYDGKYIRLRQSKGSRPVMIKVGAPLKVALEAAAKRSPIILTTLDGKPWTSDGFRASWGKACKRAGIVGVTFHDLRGTAVTRLAIADAPKRRLPLSLDIRCEACAPSSTRII
jgi:integrase